MGRVCLEPKRGVQKVRGDVLKINQKEMFRKKNNKKKKKKKQKKKKKKNNKKTQKH